MKSKPVDALQEVIADLMAAVAHYQTWRTDGKAHILEKYDETISWIAWSPDRFPRCRLGRIQRAILKQSYYIVYFLQESERTLILAVLDGRRSPTTIRSMLKERARRTI